MAAIATSDVNGNKKLKGRGVINSIRHGNFEGFNKHPRVQATQCDKAIKRLKAGPANIPAIIAAGNQYTDTSFEGEEALYGGSDDTRYTDYKN